MGLIGVRARAHGSPPAKSDGHSRAGDKVGDEIGWHKASRHPWIPRRTESGRKSGCIWGFEWMEEVRGSSMGGKLLAPHAMTETHHEGSIGFIALDLV